MKNKTFFIWLVIFTISIAFVISLHLIKNHEKTFCYKKMVEASEIMSESMNIIKEYKILSDIPIDRTYDPNNTGLIGEDFSTITTTNGDLEAKRTTTNPNFGGLLVYLLLEAGVKKGDYIAIGASGSFPALLIATLSASKALDLNPVIIGSIGSSMWGANNPELTWIDMYSILYDKKVFNYNIAAVSLGGYLDTGKDIEEYSRSLLIEKVNNYNIPFIYEENLTKNVQIRAQFYDAASKNNNFSAFINIGGSSANIGISSKVLSMKPGLNTKIDYPAENEQGILHYMAKQNIPVIHLLYMKGLVIQYALPWDPIPLPAIGQNSFYYKEFENRDKLMIVIILTYITIIFSSVYYIWKLRNENPAL